MKFKTLIIDPPWPYRDTAGGLQGCSDTQYKPLSICDLAALPVGQIMDEREAYVLMWATSPFLADATSLFPAWGFKYITSAVWLKHPGMGVGHWFRGDHEHMLLGKRKTAKSFRTNRRSVFREAPRGKHSAKPPFLHEFVERFLPPPYLEIFARDARPNWVVCGNQAPGDGKDIRDTLAIMACLAGVT